MSDNFIFCVLVELSWHVISLSLMPACYFYLILCRVFQVVNCCFDIHSQEGTIFQFWCPFTRQSHLSVSHPVCLLASVQAGKNIAVNTTAFRQKIQPFPSVFDEMWLYRDFQMELQWLRWTPTSFQWKSMPAFRAENYTYYWIQHSLVVMQLIDWFLIDQVRGCLYGIVSSELMAFLQRDRQSP